MKLRSGKRTEHACAKINLFLEVTGKREDGYHTLDTVMQTVSLTDGITVEVHPLPEGTESRIRLTVNTKYLPTDRRNTAYQAAEAFLAAARASAEVEITVRKQIPAAAGLGGGSADAAAVLRCLNSFAGNALSVETLLQISAGIGADVPFCFMGGCCRCEGIGEKLTPLPVLTGYYPVIAIGAQRSQTAAAYKLLDDIHYEGTRTAEAMQTALCDPAYAHTLPETMYNAFERVIFPENPRTAEIREKLMDLGAEAALLSGSGAAVYGLFREEEKAAGAVSVLRGEELRAWATRPLEPFYK